MTASWLDTLDALERHLELQVRLVEDGRYDEVVAFDPPAELPALPAPLAARVSELLERFQALIDEGAGIRDDTARRLTEGRRQTYPRTPVAAYVDQRA